MNRFRHMKCRWRALSVVMAVAITAYGVPALAQPKPKNPALTIEPVSARNLLAPAEPNWKLSLTETEPGTDRSYRLDRDGTVTGQRARISVDLGDTTLFAIGGSLNRLTSPGPPNPADVGGRKISRSKQYGAGIERTVGPVDVTASYQYSRVTPERSESNLNLSNPKSHSVRATARIRFRH